MNQKKYTSYVELLQQKEWQDKRKLILYRDSNKCIKCQKVKGRNYIYHENQNSEIERLKKLGFPQYELNKMKGGKILKNGNGEDYTFRVLHVHHKYYIHLHLPWEYPNSALVTLCNVCHTKEHAENDIIVYVDENMIDEKNVRWCTRCKGSGYIPEYHYHVDGICFKCKGVRYY